MPEYMVIIYEIEDEDVEGTIQRSNEAANTTNIEPVIDHSIHGRNFGN